VDREGLSQRAARLRIVGDRERAAAGVDREAQVAFALGRIAAAFGAQGLAQLAVGDRPRPERVARVGALEIREEGRDVDGARTLRTPFERAVEQVDGLAVEAVAGRIARPSTR
jgi:hypothetical protein